MEDQSAIARKRLIGAVARQRDRDLFARQFADAIGRQRARVGEGFVEHVGDAVDQREIGGRDGAGAVVSGEAVRDRRRIGGFVKRRLIETDGAGLDRLRARFGHQRHHRARSDAARQKGAERYVGAHPVGLIEGGRTTRPIRRGDLITRDNVVLPAGSRIVELRARQDRMVHG